MELKEPQTLCWLCKNAFGRCSWSDGSFRPVEGWLALPTRQIERSEDGVEVMESYFVYACPKFEADEERSKE